MADHLGLPEPVVVPDRRQGSGGGQGPPERDIRSHGRSLRDELDAVADAAPRRVVEGVDPRRVFKVQSTTRLADDELRRRGLQLLGDTDDWTYFLVPDDGSAEELRRALDAYAPQEEGAKSQYVDFFGRIEAIRPYGPEDRITSPVADAMQELVGALTVDIVLWPSPDHETSRRRVEDVQRALTQYGGTQRGNDLRPQSTVVRASCPLECLEAVLGLMVVERVRLPLAPRLEPSTWLTADVADVPRTEPPLDIVVGVVDDGVATGHPLLDELIVGQYAFPDDHAWKPISSHGTMVAGLASYGGFEAALSTPPAPLRPPVRIAVARVLESDNTPDPLSTHLPSAEPDHLVVEAAIRALVERHGVRIVNLSIADTFAYTGPHAGTFTETLDRLVRELDLVIVVAAGNRSWPDGGQSASGLHILDDYPAYAFEDDARLAEPAPAANVVTVGSLGLSDAPTTAYGESYVDERAIAGTHRLSPFSRTGPGVRAQFKPELVDLGGDYAWRSLGIDRRNLGTSVVSLNHEPARRLFCHGSGTSFAAPRVANLAARIVDRYPGISGNLVRALLGIAASHPEPSRDLFEEPACWMALGAGLANPDLALDCGDSRVVMLFDGEMACDSAVVHPVPVPEPFARGKSERSLAVALAFDPPVRRQRREYLAGHIAIDLFRATELDEIAKIVGQQDKDRRIPLPRNRTRVGDRLRPKSQTVLGSTLQVRRWQADHANSLSPDDGDAYYLVLTHRSESWAANLADEYTTQRYGLAVELWDRGRSEIDLYNLVQQQVTVRARARVRR